MSMIYISVSLHEHTWLSYSEW